MRKREDSQGSWDRQNGGGSLGRGRGRRPYRTWEGLQIFIQNVMGKPRIFSRGVPWPNLHFENMTVAALWITQMDKNGWAPLVGAHNMAVTQTIMIQRWRWPGGEAEMEVWEMVDSGSISKVKPEGFSGWLEAGVKEQSGWPPSFWPEQHNAWVTIYNWRKAWRRSTGEGRGGERAGFRYIQFESLLNTQGGTRAAKEKNPEFRVQVRLGVS